MNYILTASRAGSTVFLHSLNQTFTKGTKFDINALAATVDVSSIGEHAHNVTSWDVDEILKAVPPVTVVKPEQSKFFKLMSHMNSNDKVILFRRKNFNKWAQSVAVRSLTQVHHITNSDDLEDYKSLLRPLTEREIQNGRDMCNNLLKKQQDIITNANVVAPVIYFEDFLEHPSDTIERVLKYFNIWEDDMSPFCKQGIQTTCIPLPKI